MTQAPVKEAVTVEDAEELSFEADISVTDARHLIDLVEFRASNKENPVMDAIIVVDGWALDERYGPIAESRYRIAGLVEDYSEDAYKLTDAYEIDELELRDDDAWINDVVTLIDDRDDGAPAKGVTWMPKSAVGAVIDVDGDGT